MDHQVKVYVTSTTDPLFNIATEEWIFREGDPTKQTLYLWRNSPTVPSLLPTSSFEFIACPLIPPCRVAAVRAGGDRSAPESVQGVSPVRDGARERRARAPLLGRRRRVPGTVSSTPSPASFFVSPSC